MVNNKFGLSDKEYKFFKSLNTPEKIQDWIDKCNYNFCKNGYVCKAPIETMHEKSAHCFEGALFAAAALRVNGRKPLIIEFDGERSDIHLIAPFKEKGLWGAIAQSQYYTLKWRDPIFRTTRELALSYFPVYSDEDIITLRNYTRPIDLSKFDNLNWMSSNSYLMQLGDEITKFRHFNILPKGIVLRRVPEGMDSAMRKHKKD